MQKTVETEENGYRLKRETPTKLRACIPALWRYATSLYVVETDNLQFALQTREIISLMEYTHVLVVDVSRTFCCVQVCTHEILPQQVVHDGRASLPHDIVCP
jgi:hypothetical protein